MAPSIVSKHSSDGQSISKLPPIPPSNYLWKSPEGRTYPGWHHQLILSLIAQSLPWSQNQDLGLTAVKARLSTEYPGYVVDDVSLRAIAAEYLDLDSETKIAYESLISNLPSSRENTYYCPGSNLGSDAVVDNIDWKTFLDPALFEDSSSEQTPLGMKPSGAQQQVDNKSISREHNTIAPNELQQDHTGQIWVPCESSKSALETAVIHQHPVAAASNDSNMIGRPQDPTNVNGDRLEQFDDSGTSTVDTPSISSPERPEPYRFSDRQGLTVLLQPISPSPRTRPSIDPQVEAAGQPELPTSDSIEKEVDRILFFSKAIHDLQEQQKNIPSFAGMSEAKIEQTPKETSAAPRTLSSEIENTDMRLPDPTKYIQTSRKHYTIPASESAAFVYWFQPRIDALPDKIEGYFWYCDKCYVSDDYSGSGGWIKGKFNQKRSVEKHFKAIHKSKWKPELPELDRAAGMNIPESFPEVVHNTDTNEQFPLPESDSLPGIDDDTLQVVANAEGLTQKKESSDNAQQQSKIHVSFADIEYVREFDKDKPSDEFEDVNHVSNDQTQESEGELPEKKVKSALRQQRDPEPPSRRSARLRGEKSSWKGAICASDESPVTCPK